MRFCGSCGGDEFLFGGAERSEGACMAGKVVLVSADAKVDAGDFHGWQPRWVSRNWLSVNGVVKNGKADVSWLC